MKLRKLPGRENHEEGDKVEYLEPGVPASVRRIGTDGRMRMRLLELGLTEGMKIECVGRSPKGDPSSYRIRGAVVAIRESDAAKILVETEETDIPVIALAGSPECWKEHCF